MFLDIPDPYARPLECKQCGLVLNDTEELKNHVRRFCQYSDYATPMNLEWQIFVHSPKKKLEIREAKDKRVEQGRSPRSPNKKSTNYKTQLTVDKLSRELEKVKSENYPLRLERIIDQEELVKLMRFFEERKDRELRERIAREEIRFIIMGLNKKQLEILEGKSKGLYEKIDAGLETSLKHREKEIIQELWNMENERRTLKRMKEEEIKKQIRELEKAALKDLRQEKVAEILSYDVVEKSASVKIGQELREKERRKILQAHRSTAGIMAAREVLGSQQPNQTAFDLKAFLDERDRETDRLEEELRLLKYQLGSSYSDQGTFGYPNLEDISLRMGGNPKSSPRAGGQTSLDRFLYKKEFFDMNEVKSVDLSEEERLLLRLSAQEVDVLRLLSQIPVGTEIYRYKSEQLKELSTAKAEIEKIVQEQRLQKPRRDHEKPRREEDRNYDNEKFVDDWRKQIVSTKLRKDLNQNSADRNYDPTEGLVIHWDYCLGVAKRTNNLQVVYGVYINGEEAFTPRMIEARNCEVDTPQTNRCIIGESHLVADIPANSNALLVFELQSRTASTPGGERVTSYAWSQLDLFDARRELKRGKFKVPLYAAPTFTAIDIDGIKHLQPVDNGMAWVYLRVSYPSNDEFGKQQSLYPQDSHFEYVIPQLHLRGFRPEREPIKQDDKNRPLSRKTSDRSFVIGEPVKNFAREKPSNPIFEMSKSQISTTLNTPQKPSAKLPSTPTISKNKTSEGIERLIRPFDSSTPRSNKGFKLY